MAMRFYDHGHAGDIHDLYNITFYEETISTLVTNTPSSVDSWIADLERVYHRCLPNLHVGLDVQWRPNFVRNHENPVATLQLCMGHSCLIFQILHSPGIPWSLINFLRNPSYTFYGVGIHGDVEKLQRDYNLEVANAVDVRDMAADPAYGMTEVRNSGLKEMTRRVLGKEVSKPAAVTMSRWDSQRLTPEQVQYACIDAFLSFKIWFEIARVMVSRGTT